MTKIATIVGARPQFIKAAVVSHALREVPGLGETLIHTGQHYDDNMSRVFFEQLDIPRPDFNLGIGSAPHGAQTGRMLEGIEATLQQCQPDWVLIYGDTNSTLAGALAAAKLRIPLAHVEAGLRSFNRNMPEEINRVVADCLADVLFATTDTSKKNLLAEGVPPDKIHLVGDVMYDAALQYGPRADRESDILQQLPVTAGQYVLATIHRAENTDDVARLTAIFLGLAEISADIPVLLPLHPRTASVLRETGLEAELPPTLLRIGPVGYLEMMALERRARLIVTDSGGVQKEAFFHKVGCVTLRDETEWTELVEMGCNRIVKPTGADEVTAALRDAISREIVWPTDERLFGGGRAGERIADFFQR